MAKQKIDVSYEEMSGNTKVLEESEVPYWNPPLINNFEADIPYGKGYDQSGFKKSTNRRSR